ncbi:hypothetical protein M378DRAFT_164275, partial [Amanita muscaria Koide BX008]
KTLSVPFVTVTASESDLNVSCGAWGIQTAALLTMIVGVGPTEFDDIVLLIHKRDRVFVAKRLSGLGEPVT